MTSFFVKVARRSEQGAGVTVKDDERRLHGPQDVSLDGVKSCRLISKFCCIDDLQMRVGNVTGSAVVWPVVSCQRGLHLRTNGRVRPRKRRIDCGVHQRSVKRVLEICNRQGVSIRECSQRLQNVARTIEWDSSGSADSNCRPFESQPSVVNVDNALEEAKLPPMTIHDLRHTAASLAISAGANVKAVQRMLGHASAAMTLDTYADLFDDDLDSVAMRLSEAATSTNVVKMWSKNQNGHP